MLICAINKGRIIIGKHLTTQPVFSLVYFLLCVYLGVLYIYTFSINYENIVVLCISKSNSVILSVKLVNILLCILISTSC